MLGLVPAAVAEGPVNRGFDGRGADGRGAGGSRGADGRGSGALAHPRPERVSSSYLRHFWT